MTVEGNDHGNQTMPTSIAVTPTAEPSAFGTGMTRRNFLLLMQLAGLAVAGSHAAGQMMTGRRMGDFDDVFGVHPEARIHQYAAVLTKSSHPGCIFYHGETPHLTFQLQNLGKKRIKCRGKLDIIAYGTRGIAGNIWVPQVYKIKDVSSIPIDVDMPGGNGFQDITLEVPLPAINGGYSLVVDLGQFGRRMLTSVVRTFRLDHLPRAQYPQQSLDNVTPPVLERLGIQAIRYDIGYWWSGGNGYAQQLRQLETSLRELHKHKITCLLEIGAGTAPQPLGMPRPHLTAKGMMEGGKCDYAWLPQYDEDYKKFVYHLASNYGWPKGPITAFGLWNEPWEGRSISGWQADMLRYRELYKLMGDAIFAARDKAGVEVLLGGACSSMNAWDKLFPEGLENSPFWPQYFDFCSIHYQGLGSPCLYRQWDQRKFYQGRVKVWDTESWVANTDDRVAGVLASNRAAGYDRSMGIFYGNVIGGVANGQLHSITIRTEKGNKNITQPPFAWSTAASLCAVQHFLGERQFKEILFQYGLPWVYVFDGLNGKQEDGTVVVLGDLSVMNGDNPDRIPYRTVRSLHEVQAKAKLRHELSALPADATAQRASLEKALQEPMAWEDVRMILQAPGTEFSLHDYYGNAVPAENGQITIPLNTNGYFLRASGKPGSFAALVAALRSSRIEGLTPVEIIAHDFTAPISTRPVMTVVINNVLNRAISGVLSVSIKGLQMAGPVPVSLAPHQHKSVALHVTGGTDAPANLYPLAIKFDAGKDGVALQYDTMRVNFISRKTIKVDGDLADWEGVLPQTIQTREAAHESLTEAAWLPMKAFAPGQAGGVATTYLAYDDDYFYFAAKVADDAACAGTWRFADQEKYAHECFYPETSRRVQVNKSLRMVEKIQAAAPGETWALERPDGHGRINGQWQDDPAVNALAFAMDFDIPADRPEQVAIYIPPHNFAPQGQVLELIDRENHRILSRQSIGRLYQGVYAVYVLRGKMRIVVQAAGNWYSSRVGGLFFDTVAAGAKTGFVRWDYKTSGNWKGKYGTGGYNVIGTPPKYPPHVTVTTPQHTAMQTLDWPEGVRRFTYRRNPVTPGCGSPMDNIQIAFNAVPGEEKKQWITNLPGRPPKFIWYKDTDYEYSLNLVAEKYGGGTEIWRMLVPGMPPKNFFPRQPKSPWDGAVTDGKLVIKYVGNTRLVECAIPWKEIPDVHKLMLAGKPVKFTCRVNRVGGGPLMELPMHRLASRVNTPALDAQWEPHWANELAFGWEK